MSEEIRLKFKMADSKQVTLTIETVVREWVWFNRDQSHPEVGFVTNLVRDIQLALCNLGCVIIQLDHEDLGDA